MSNEMLKWWEFPCSHRERWSEMYIIPKLWKSSCAAYIQSTPTWISWILNKLFPLREFKKMSETSQRLESRGFCSRPGEASISGTWRWQSVMVVLIGDGDGWWWLQNCGSMWFDMSKWHDTIFHYSKRTCKSWRMRFCKTEGHKIFKNTVKNKRQPT